MILELGLKKFAELDINKYSALPLKKLSNDTNKTCSLGIYYNNSVIVTLHMEPAREYGRSQSSIPNVRRKPAYCTSLGKIFLAFLPEEAIEKYLNEVELLPFTKNTITNRDNFIEELVQIKKQGYSKDRKEYVSYMISFAAPVYGISGKLEGAIGISSNMDDYDEESLNKLIEPLIRTAYEISINMGYQPTNL